MDRALTSRSLKGPSPILSSTWSEGGKSQDTLTVDSAHADSGEASGSIGTKDAHSAVFNSVFYTW
jgi:hypothetical protein